jgi:hypothetical protein
MKCPKCGHQYKSPVAQAGGRAGGQARVAKGFAAPDVLAKALATRRKSASKVVRAIKRSGRKQAAVAGAR